MQQQDIERALQGAGFTSLIPALDRLVRPSLRLTATPVDESTLPPGASKLGGLPDLAPGTPWPQWKGLPQSFLAQLRLADLSHTDTQHLLPAQGMLWFFYDAQQETYGDTPDERGAWSVLYQASIPASLQRTPAPAALPADARFHACSLSPSSELTLAQQPALEIPTLKWTDDDQERYDKVYAQFSGPDVRKPPLHRLLGFPDTLQDDMRMQCQLVTHGVTDADDPRAKALAAGANDWLLLLQIDTDERIGMRWASSGILYYWIQQADLHAAQFEKTWLVLQSE